MLWSLHIVALFEHLKQNTNQGFFQQFWEKAPGQNWEKTIDLTSKLGEINGINITRVAKYILKIELFLIVLCQAYHLSTSV